MLKRFVDAIVALGVSDSNFACLSAWIFDGGTLEAFARFQAGFLSSEDFHRFLLIFMGFLYRFSTSSLLPSVSFVLLYC